MIGLVEPLRDVQYPEQGVSSVMKENRSSLLGFVSRDGSRPNGERDYSGAPCPRNDDWNDSIS